MISELNNLFEIKIIIIYFLSIYLVLILAYSLIF